jgi:Protein of unknown function (DUF2971)
LGFAHARGAQRGDEEASEEEEKEVSTRTATITNSEKWPAPPPILYRYIPLDHLDEVIRGKLRFSSPRSFNDPFDCQLFPTLRGSRSDSVNFFARVLKAKSRLNRAGRRGQARQKAPILNQESFEKAFANTNIRSGSRGILCFSEPRSDILMWAHYANKHTGVCCGFDTNLDFFRDIRQVTYNANYPKENLLLRVARNKEEDQREIMRFIFFTKSEHWSYEKEWRLIRETYATYPFPIESLVEVNFGCQAREQEMSAAIEKLAKLTIMPRIFRASVSKTEFALDFKRGTP